jgi:hypothetical protein
MSDRIISFSNGVEKNFGKVSVLLSEVITTLTGFSVNFYISNGKLLTFTREDVSNDAFTIAAAAYGVEQRVKAATNLKQEDRTAEKVAELVEKVLTTLSESGWTSTRNSGSGAASKPSTFELAFLSVEGNTKEAWDALDSAAKRNVRKDPRVNKAYLQIQADAVVIPEVTAVAE